MDISDFKKIDALNAYLDGADHVDVRSGDGNISMREFAAGIMTYQPGWMRALWKVRVWLLKALGQGKHEVPAMSTMTAETLPVVAGEKAAFFTVADSDGETFWIATGEESHLGAALGVVVEPLKNENGLKRFHLITAVQYRNWAGPWYFNIIRPFHHLVVASAMKDILSNKSAD